MTNEERDQMQVVADLLADIGGDPCDCDGRERDACTVTSPLCSSRKLERARLLASGLIEPTYGGLHPERLRHFGTAEVVYIQHWQRQQIRQAGVNSGMTMLEGILKPAAQAWVERPSQRDADVATAVIQWLGTNCGQAFVSECEREVAERRADRRAMDTQWTLSSIQQRGQAQVLADQVLLAVHGAGLSKEVMNNLAARIQAALVFSAAMARSGQQ